MLVDKVILTIALICVALFHHQEGIGMAAVPAAEDSPRWYLSLPRGNETMPDATAFYMADFDAGTLTELPLGVNGARASLMAVSASGRLLLSYAYLGERGFAVYTPSGEVAPSTATDAGEAEQTDVSITLSTDQIEHDQIYDWVRILYTIHNDGPKEVHTDIRYRLEKLDGGQWSPLPLDNIVWPLEDWPIPAGGTKDGTIWFDAFADDFAPGDYRLAKKIYVEGERAFTVYAPFSIV